MFRVNPKLTEKNVKYIIPSRVQKLMAADRKNKRLWSQIRKMEFWSEYEFLHYIFDEAVACSSNACSKPIKVTITLFFGFCAPLLNIKLGSYHDPLWPYLLYEMFNNK